MLGAAAMRQQLLSQADGKDNGDVV